MNHPTHDPRLDAPVPRQVSAPMLGTAKGAASQPQQQFDPWIIWVTFRRCWHWAFPVGAVLAGIAAFFVVQSFEPSFKASAMLEANEDYVLQKIFPSMTGDDLSKTEKPVLFDRMVLDLVLENPNLQTAPSLADPETAEANLRKNLSVNGAGSKKRMSISYVDTDKQAAADVCNAIVDAYLQRRDEFDNARAGKLDDWLGPEIELWESKVLEHKNKVKSLSTKAVGVTLGETDDEGKYALLNSLRQQIADLTVEIKFSDVERKMRGDFLDKSAAEEIPMPEFVPTQIPVERIAPTESQIDAMVDRDEKVQTAKANVQFYDSSLLQMEAAGLKRVKLPDYRDLQALREQRVALLDQAMEEARPRVTQQLNDLADEDFERRQREAEMQIDQQREQHEEKFAQAMLDRGRNIENLQAQDDFDRDSLVEKLNVLEDSLTAEAKRLSELGGNTVDLQFLVDDLSVANLVLVQLRNRVAAIQTERQKGGNIRTLAPAKPPRAPVETVPIKEMVAVSGAVFMLPFLIGLLWEFRVQRVADSSAVENSTTLAPLVGEVARLPSGTAPGKGRRLFEESIETLRSNLFLSVQTRDTRTIAVASSMSGEGKSSVASQLAISIAKASGETVLLVDADLRCPDQHEIFGLEMGPGLCGVLSGDATLSDAVDNGLGDLVHVLPAGQLNASPHRLISPESMRDFFDDAMKTYTYVVVDTAPVLAAGETLAVSAAVDATLLCVMRDVSRMDCMNKTTRRLNAAGANVVGTVFSGVAASKYAYRYGDYQYALPSDV